MHLIKFIKNYLYEKKKEKVFYRRIKRKMEKIASGLPAFSNNNFDCESSYKPYYKLPYFGEF